MEHTCGTCGRQFRRKTELDHHTKRRNPCKQPAYTCKRCRKGFASYKIVWRHEKTIHSEPATSCNNADTAVEQCREQQTADANSAGEAVVSNNTDTAGEAQAVATLR